MLYFDSYFGFIYLHADTMSPQWCMFATSHLFLVFLSFRYCITYVDYVSYFRQVESFVFQENCLCFVYLRVIYLYACNVYIRMSMYKALDLGGILQNERKTIISMNNNHYYFFHLLDIILSIIFSSYRYFFYVVCGCLFKLHIFLSHHQCLYIFIFYKLFSLFILIYLNFFCYHFNRFFYQFFLYCDFYFI